MVILTCSFRLYSGYSGGGKNTSLGTTYSCEHGVQCCEIHHDSREPRLAGNSDFRFLGLHPHTHHPRWKDRNFSYHVQEKRPAHEVPDDVIACHLLMTVGCECHQQVGTHDGQTAANEG